MTNILQKASSAGKRLARLFIFISGPAEDRRAGAAAHLGNISVFLHKSWQDTGRGRRHRASGERDARAPRRAGGCSSRWVQTFHSRGQPSPGCSSFISHVQIASILRPHLARSWAEAGARWCRLPLCFPPVPHAQDKVTVPAATAPMWHCGARTTAECL